MQWSEYLTSFNGYITSSMRASERRESRCIFDSTEYFSSVWWLPSCSRSHLPRNESKSPSTCSKLISFSSCSCRSKTTRAWSTIYNKPLHPSCKRNQLNHKIGQSKLASYFVEQMKISTGQKKWRYPNLLWFLKASSLRGQMWNGPNYITTTKTSHLRYGP